MARVMDGSSDYNSDFRVVCPDDSIHWMNSRGELTLGENGEPLLLSGSCIDITERKCAEQALLEN